METSLIPKFNHNQFHVALYLWHVEGRRDFVSPVQPPYYDNSFFDSIKKVKQQGILNLKTMTSGEWHMVLLEINVTHRLTASGREELLPCRIEANNPALDWDKIWALSATTGLPSSFLTFLWQMVHDLLPCQSRLYRLRMPNTVSEICTLCNSAQVGDLTHSLVMCSYNGGAGNFLVDKLHHVLPHVQPHQVVQLDFDVEQDLQLPLVFLTSSVLSQVWECRKQKKPCHLFTIRATLEAGVNILRKSRHVKAADRLLSILEIS